MISLLPTGIPVAANYIDPGTISMVIQVIIATLVGGAVVFRVYLRKLVTFLIRWRKKK